jgi:hypothetical protein
LAISTLPFSTAVFLVEGRPSFSLISPSSTPNSPHPVAFGAVNVLLTSESPLMTTMPPSSLIVLVPGLPVGPPLVAPGVRFREDDRRVAGGILHSVKKTSIYIDPEVDRALARRAAAQGTSKAAVIRDALAQAGAAAALARPRAAGVFDGPGDLSQDVDGHLAGTDFGES